MDYWIRLRNIEMKLQLFRATPQNVSLFIEHDILGLWQEKKIIRHRRLVLSLGPKVSCLALIWDQNPLRLLHFIWGPGDFFLQ